MPPPLIKKKIESFSRDLVENGLKTKIPDFT